MPFYNDIIRYNTQTLNHCDVFNDVNVKLLQNTLYNKQTIEQLFGTFESDVTNRGYSSTILCDDFNTATKNGKYYNSSIQAKNIPVSGKKFCVDVTLLTINTGIQKAVSDDDIPLVYIRRFSNGSFSKWILQPTADNVIALVDQVPRGAQKNQLFFVRV